MFVFSYFSYFSSFDTFNPKYFYKKFVFSGQYICQVKKDHKKDIVDIARDALELIAIK